MGLGQGWSSRHNTKSLLITSVILISASSLLPWPAPQVDEGTVVVRLQVDDTHRLERSTYSVTMVQRLGGIYDG